MITLSEGQFQQVGEFFCDEIFQYVVNYYRYMYIYNIEDMTSVYDIVYIYISYLYSFPISWSIDLDSCIPLCLCPVSRMPTFSRCPL